VRRLAARSPLTVGVWLASLVFAGCRADPNMQLAEQELRLQDQRIFELEEHLSDCHAVVAAYQRDIAALRRQVDDNPKKDLDEPAGAWDANRRLKPEPPGELTRPLVDEGDALPGASQLPSLDSDRPIEEFDPGEDAAPEFDPSPERGAPPDPADASDSDPLPLQLDVQSVEPTSEPLPAPSVTGSADQIEQIGLRLAVRYHTAETVPVQVEAIVEPRDGELRQIPAAGDVSLMVAAADGPAERQLARWDFAAEDVRHLWKRSKLGDGLQFELPWPGSPQPGKYRLWVRFVGSDGRKHLGSVDFDVDATALARRPAPRVSPEGEPVEGPTLARRDTVEHEPRERDIPKLSSTSGGDAWRSSEDAARLAQRDQTLPPALTAVSTTRLAPASTPAETPAAWTPARPARAAAAPIETAKSRPQWSPYR
jgi:hypothetical protein